MALDDNETLARRYFDEVWNEGDADAVESLVHPDYRGHDPTVDDLQGPADIKAQVDVLRTGFPDLRIEVDQLVTEGESVAARWTARGTHRGPFLGIPGTRQVVEISGMSMLRFEDGKIVEGWLERDTIGILRRIAPENFFEAMFEALSGRASQGDGHDG
jgi:steroid delta-isomerase-like uncharacterized protein